MKAAASNPRQPKGKRSRISFNMRTLIPMGIVFLLILSVFYPLLHRDDLQRFNRLGTISSQELEAMILDWRSNTVYIECKIAKANRFQDDGGETVCYEYYDSEQYNQYAPYAIYTVQYDKNDHITYFSFEGYKLCRKPRSLLCDTPLFSAFQMDTNTFF